MSWNISVSSGTKEEVKKALEEQEFPNEPGTYAYDEMREQFDAAKMAALALLESGVVGSDQSLFAVSLSGHGNPGHVPAPGWASDMIHITLSEVIPPKPLEAVS